VSTSKHLRVAVRKFEQQGLKVVRIDHKGRHPKLVLADGRLAVMARGSGVDPNWEQIVRDQARRMARQAAPTSPQTAATGGHRGTSA
jgi:hypothetical protein